MDQMCEVVCAKFSPIHQMPVDCTSNVCLAFLDGHLFACLCSKKAIYYFIFFPFLPNSKKNKQFFFIQYVKKNVLPWHLFAIQVIADCVLSIIDLLLAACQNSFVCFSFDFSVIIHFSPSLAHQLQLVVIGCAVNVHATCAG